MELKACIMTGDDIKRALKRMAHQISERNSGCKDVVLLGIKRGGVPLAERLCENLKEIDGVDVPVGVIDITHYRDDRPMADASVISETVVDFEIEGKTVVLVDDVIYTGRTCRAALDAVSKLGRAGCIQLAVLVDRGHRELPIRADYVGKNVPTSKTEIVSVSDCVNLFSKE